MEALLCGQCEAKGSVLAGLCEKVGPKLRSHPDHSCEQNLFIVLLLLRRSDLSAARHRSPLDSFLHL